MADDARELVEQAERDAESGDHSSALKALERAYARVQKARDIETTDRALALARILAHEQSLSGGERRKARGIASWYDMLARGHAHEAGRRSLAWIDSLIVAAPGDRAQHPACPNPTRHVDVRPNRMRSDAAAGPRVGARPLRKGSHERRELLSLA